MARLIVVIVLALLNASCAQRGASLDEENDGEETAVAVPVKGQCPAGHHALVAVPDSIERSLFENEDGTFPPRTKGHLRCSQCGYRQDPKHLFWERDGDRADAFGIPLTSLIAGLSIPERGLLTREMEFYSQYVKEGEVRWENVIYRTMEPYEQVLARVERYLKSTDVHITARDPDSLNPKRGVNFRGTWRGMEFTGEVVYVDTYEDTYVRLELMNGSIWNDDDGNKPFDLDPVYN